MNRILLLLLLFIFASSYAQVKFGKISKEELALSKSELEPEAAAEIISKVGRYEVAYNKVTEAFEVNKEVEVRIKVYDKDKTPTHLLNMQVPTYIMESSKEKIFGVRASTFNLEDGKIKETKVGRSDIFTEKMSDYLEVHKLAFPNVQNGSILEYKYTINTTRFFDLDTWFIQDEVPVKYNRFYIQYPEFFVYKKDFRGGFAENIKTNRKRSEFTFSNITEELIYENLAALKEEPFVQNTDNLKTSIRYELQEYSNPGYGYQNFSKTWSQIVNDLFNSSSYGGELSGNNFLDDDVDTFNSIEDPIKRMNAIFEFVKENYTWNKYLGLSPDKGTRKTFREKTGNGTDLNFILISMLRKSGFEAYPVVLSTVENGMLNYFPTKQKLNHTITGVLLDGEPFIMDPTEKLSKINMLPRRDLNFVGYMMMDGGSYKEVNLVNQINSEIKNTIIYEIKDERVHGNFVQTKTNYFAMNDLRRKADDESNFEKKIAAGFDVDVVGITSRENSQNDAIRYQVDFQDSKSMEMIGNKMFIKPLLFTATKSNAFKFKNEERQYPLEFGTPMTYLTQIKFTIPEGYVVESLPSPKKVLLSQDAGGYSIEFNQEGDHVVAQALLHIGYSVLPQSFYKEVRNMFEKVIEVENEQIILQKK